MFGNQLTINQSINQSTCIRSILQMYKHVTAIIRRYFLSKSASYWRLGPKGSLSSVLQFEGKNDSGVYPTVKKNHLKIIIIKHNKKC
jgi:hypothetical protein